MRRQIYLDCDGVLADFEAGARMILGAPSGEYRLAHGNRHFWTRLRDAHAFFDSLALLPDAMVLYEAVKDKKPIILTGTPVGSWAEPQKRRWAARHFPGTPVITTAAALKREHCHPGDVLVDDRDDFRHLWEEAGGVFIHHTDAATSIAELKARAFI